jgi:hypothetical protein
VWGRKRGFRDIDGHGCCNRSHMTLLKADTLVVGTNTDKSNNIDKVNKITQIFLPNKPQIEKKLNKNSHPRKKLRGTC